MFKTLFYSFYSFSEFMKSNIPGGIFHDPKFDALILLSVFEFLNISSAVIYFKIGNITTNTTIDVILGLITLIMSNYFIFVFKDRHLKIFKENLDTISSISFTLVYVALSIFVFYNIHSGNWVMNYTT